MPHTLEIDEEQRQLLLMALAHLAVERPGWDYALGEIAAKIDNPVGLSLYTEFKALHVDSAASTKPPATAAAPATAKGRDERQVPNDKGFPTTKE